MQNESPEEPVSPREIREKVGEIEVWFKDNWHHFEPNVVLAIHTAIEWATTAEHLDILQEWVRWGYKRKEREANQTNS